LARSITDRVSCLSGAIPPRGFSFGAARVDFEPYQLGWPILGAQDELPAADKTLGLVLAADAVNTPAGDPIVTTARE
jgi:hypothetical protein